ncbi:MAG: Hercynine oxygenase [Gammaproteobacteria bacterium]|nr:Hercynine oxygenase [Gammaproteobacteria bacterium]
MRTNRRLHCLALLSIFFIVFPFQSIAQETFTVSLPNLAVGDRALKLVRILAMGESFQIGSPDSEIGHVANEGPQQTVTFTKDYFIGECEVTLAQWQAVMGTGVTSGEGDGPNFPVHSISWDDITGSGKFLALLNALGQGSFRLPSEAEWEYACRGGNGNPNRDAMFSFGIVDGLDIADCAPNMVISQHMWWCGNQTGQTHEVGLKLVNPLKLFDLHGNVSEWCQDNWHDTYTGLPLNGVAWEESGITKRVFRNGSWRNTPALCRSAMRAARETSFTSEHLGFRLVRDIDLVPSNTSTPTSTKTLTATLTPTVLPTPTPVDSPVIFIYPNQADINGSGDIDILDLYTLSHYWRENETEFGPGLVGDLDFNQITDQRDLLVFLSDFREETSLSTTHILHVKVGDRDDLSVLWDGSLAHPMTSVTVQIISGDPSTTNLEKQFTDPLGQCVFTLEKGLRYFIYISRTGVLMEYLTPETSESDLLIGIPGSGSVDQPEAIFPSFSGEFPIQQIIASTTLDKVDDFLIANPNVDDFILFGTSLKEFSAIPMDIYSTGFDGLVVGVLENTEKERSSLSVNKLTSPALSLYVGLSIDAEIVVYSLMQEALKLMDELGEPFRFDLIPKSNTGTVGKSIEFEVKESLSGKNRTEDVKLYKGFVSNNPDLGMFGGDTESANLLYLMGATTKKEPLKVYAEYEDKFDPNLRPWKWVSDFVEVKVEKSKDGANLHLSDVQVSSLNKDPLQTGTVFFRVAWINNGNLPTEKQAKLSVYDFFPSDPPKNPKLVKSISIEKLKAAESKSSNETVNLPDAGDHRILFILDPMDGANPPWGDIPETNERLTDNSKSILVTIFASPDPTLNRVEISQGPQTVNEDSSTYYRAKAFFSDGTKETSKDVTNLVSWKVEPSTYASMDSSVKGRLNTKSVSSDQTVTVSASYTSGGVTKTGNKIVTIKQTPPALDRVEISLGPSSVNENSSADYKAKAYFKDGSIETSQDVTSLATWVVNSKIYASMDTSIKGRLNTSSVDSNQTVVVSAIYKSGQVSKTGQKTITIVDTNNGAPIITSISPVKGERSNGQVTITGSGFSSTYSQNTLTIGGVPVTLTGGSGTTQLSLTTLPVGVPIGTDIQVTVKNKDTNQTSAVFHWTVLPTIDQIIATSGKPGDSVVVKLRGTATFGTETEDWDGFPGMILFGSKKATVTAVSKASGQTSVAVTVPQLSTGATTIVAKYNDAASTAKSFTVQPGSQVPTISSISPAQGERSSGPVTITGSNFETPGGNNTLTIGGTDFTPAGTGGTQLTLSSLPVGAPIGNPVHVSVTANNQTSAPYNWIVRPTIDQISPDSGKPGDSVVVKLLGTATFGTSTGDWDGSPGEIKFGSTTATVTAVSKASGQTSVTVTVPQLSAGALTVTAKYNSATSTGISFTVQSGSQVPTISSISPAQGERDTGPITIAGSNFADTAAQNEVIIQYETGSAPATVATVFGTSQLTITKLGIGTPIGSPVQVTVKNKTTLLTSAPFSWIVRPTILADTADSGKPGDRISVYVNGTATFSSSNADWNGVHGEIRIGGVPANVAGVEVQTGQIRLFVDVPSLSAGATQITATYNSATSLGEAFTVTGGGGGDIIEIPLPNLPAGARPLRLVLIPAGSFHMGSPDTERGRNPFEDKNEGPVHAVTITNPFYIGETEVTQAQWKAVMNTNFPSGSDVGPDYPVFDVSWNEITQANGFLEKLDAQTSYNGFRLPTEAEWEYACRAETTTRFSFGDNLSCDDSCGTCVLADQYMWWCGNNTPNAVGTKTVHGRLHNAFGLYDMHGNVWEWCQDWYQSDFYSQPGATAPDPLCTNSTSGFRAARGGYWGSYAGVCRSATRGFAVSSHRSHQVGVRVVLPASP